MSHGALDQSAVSLPPLRRKLMGGARIQLLPISVSPDGSGRTLAMEVELSSGGLPQRSDWGEIAPCVPVEANDASSAAPEVGVVVPRTSHGAEGVGRKSREKGRRGGPSSSVSSSSSSAPPPWQRRGSGVHLRSRRRRESVGVGAGDDLQDLALSLGMSFAAVVAQVCRSI